MPISKRKVVLNTVTLSTPDDFTYFESYINYLTKLREDLIDSTTAVSKVYLEMDYEYSYDDIKEYTVKVVREESDKEYRLRTRTEDQKRKDADKIKKAQELKLLEELKAKYPEN